jgi:hypothetical protein
MENHQPRYNPIHPNSIDRQHNASRIQILFVSQTFPTCLLQTTNRTPSSPLGLLALGSSVFTTSKRDTSRRYILRTTCSGFAALVPIWRDCLRRDGSAQPFIFRRRLMPRGPCALEDRPNAASAVLEYKITEVVVVLPTQPVSFQCYREGLRFPDTPSPIADERTSFDSWASRSPNANAAVATAATVMTNGMTGARMCA